MITLRYKRFNDGIFVPHVDVLRSLNRTFRRAGIDVRYSNGFNHHMALRLTQPIPFGVADDDAYVTADIKSDYPLEEIYDRFVKACPPYIRPLGAYVTELNPSLGGTINASSYRVQEKLNAEQVEKINAVSGKEYEITLRKNGGADKKEVSSLIYCLKADEDGFDATLAFGNVNLRIDLLIEQFNDDFGTAFSVTDVVRTKQLIRQADGNMLSAEDYLLGKCTEKYISKE